MREIKFRAWDKELKRMRPVTNLDFAAWNVHYEDAPNENLYFNGDRNSFANQETDRCVVMQFTGLLDKNGKEIYEGDVVCSDRYSAPSFEVVFSEGAYRLKDETGRVFAPFTGGSEVIGNIYENPELLTKQP